MKGKLLNVVTAIVVLLAGLALGGIASPVAAQAAWYAEYFANQDLAGGPALTRYEDRLDFVWGAGSPGGGIPSDHFSARFTRTEWFEAGTYRFSYRSDDGIRVWVGDTLVVDDWREHQPVLVAVDRVINRGTQPVRVEYFEATGGASLQLNWERVSGGEGWRGEYYDNRSLSGAPVLVRYDAAIDFDWKMGSPGGTVPADNFSVRWTRTLGFTAGTYRFNSSSDDGVRVYVDGRGVVDAWGDGQLPNTRSGDVNVSEGQHTVVVEYYEHGGNASAHVWWNRLGSFSGWQGRYFDNAELRGGPALVRDDAEINFDWGEGAPVAWMPSDNFSAVWSRQVNLAPGFYRFNARADDGVRVWLDEALIMDYWGPQDYQWHYADGFYLEGLHTLKVEYFERTGNARMRFWWESSGTTPPTGGPPASPVATPAPSAPPAPSTPGPWAAEYFNNRTLSGQPILTRSDAAIDFDWGWGAPAPQVNQDNFSARWTGTFQFVGGRYTFRTTSDDGVRVTVDGTRVIDGWRLMRGSRTGTVNVGAGTHTVRVEYFEGSGRANVRLTWQLVQASNQGSVVDSGVAQPSPSKAGGAVRLDAWPVSSSCTGGGWMAQIFVEGRGGDGLYTYSWEGQKMAGPTGRSATFEVRSASRGIAIVGEAAVTSGGQTAEVELFVRAPTCP